MVPFEGLTDRRIDELGDNNFELFKEGDLVIAGCDK